MEGRAITIGKITRLRGLRGEVVAVASSGEYSIFEKIKEVRISGHKVRKSFRIERIAALKDRVALKFEGVDSREKASRLVGHELQIEAEDLPDLPVGHFYHYRLVGLKVVDTRGGLIGKVAEVLENPGNDIFVVESPTKAEILIPAVKEVVKKIDLEEGSMEIDLIPGLLEE